MQVRKAKCGIRKSVKQSSFVFEEAFRSAALFDGDSQEVGGHISHQDLFHVAERGPPCHFIQVNIKPGRGRPVQKVRLFHWWKLGGATQALAHFRLVLEVWRCQVAGAVLSSVSVHVCPVWMQAAVRVELLVGAPTGDSPTVCVVMVVVVVMMVVMLMAVSMVVWMSVGHFDQPHILTSMELRQFVRDVAHLLICSPLVRLRDHRAAAAVLEAGLRLWASFFGYVDVSIRTGLLKRGLLVLTATQF